MTGWGYARSEGKICYAATTKRSLLKRLPLIPDVVFSHKLFHEHKPVGKLVYCDPPYAGTTAYGAFDNFDHDLFWAMMSKWTENNTVVVSEYAAPEGWKCVAEFQSRMGMATEGGRDKRSEKMFRLDDVI